MKTRNPFKRVARSIRKHGVLSTARMAFRLSLFNASLIPSEAKVLWAKISRGGVVIRQVQGSGMMLDLSDKGISRELFLTGVHEANSTLQFKEELRPGMVVLEIGANIGYYALIAAQRTAPNGLIVALEPSPVNVRSLHENLRLNGIQDRVRVFPFGAGREAAIAPFYIINKGNLSGFVKRDDNVVRPLSVIDVEVLPVDDLLKREDIKADYFRMDVEGLEADVIEGMVKTLNGPEAPLGGFIEVHPVLLKERGSSVRLFLERLRELGYRIKVARYRGRSDTVVHSYEELFSHPLFEASGCWEAFFVRSKGAV